MNKKIIFTLALIGSLHAAPQISYANEDQNTQELQREEQSLETAAKSPHWDAAVKERYKLTDDQIAKMKDAGIKGPQIAMTSQLAESSGKSIDDIIKMRTQDKMGWGKIAKELGVPPKTIGQGVASLRREVKADRKEHREKMKEKHQEKREARDARREAREKRREGKN